MPPPRCSQLPVRYGVLAHDLGKGATPRRAWPDHGGHEMKSVRLAERMSARLKVPLDCRDAGRLVARWHGVVHAAREQTPAVLLDLLTAADALRRPERLDMLLEACECDALSLPGRGGVYAQAQFVRDALGDREKRRCGGGRKEGEGGRGEETGRHRRRCEGGARRSAQGASRVADDYTRYATARITSAAARINRLIG